MTEQSASSSAMGLFSAPTVAWFTSAFAQPTPVQCQGWPHLAQREHVLLLAPTGSGKTLAAFLWALDRLTHLDEGAEPGVRVLYVSPLKALVYDIERNLRAPLAGVRRAAEARGETIHRSSVDLRTGDTSGQERRRQLRRPADILATTPESLFLLLGSQAAGRLRTVETVIVDEIHTFASSKRGVHLALSLERLSECCEAEPQRVGLSATVRPAGEVARFLGGDRPVRVVDASEPPEVELEVRGPLPDMEHPPPPKPETTGGSRVEGWRTETSGVWPAIYPQLLDLIEAHRSTIIFTNSRSLCERLAARLNEQAGGQELVRAHHGSLSRERRAEIEEALKSGQLRGLVATSSMELGVDMESVELVVLVESPGSVARGLQRVGRAGHAVGARSHGVVIPKFRGDLLECAVVVKGMLEGRLEEIRVPRGALDVLAQQVVALCADRERKVEDVHRLVCRAMPYEDLSREALVSVLDMLSGRFPSDELADLRPRLDWDRARDVLRTRPGGRMLSLMNAGTIPDRGLYGVHLGPGGPRIGELDEEMVHESRPGDTFYLGASTWRVLDITRDRVVVAPAAGEPARMPFWRGEGPGRPIELGRQMGAFLRELVALDEPAAVKWLASSAGLDAWACENLLAYVREQQQHTGTLPTDRAVTVERFRDELGDWRITILTPFGARVHAPWALALEASWGRRGVGISSMHTDDGIVLRFADGETLPQTDELLPPPEEVEDLVIEQLGHSTLFASAFRENAARALLLPRRGPRRRTALWQQRLRAQSLLASVRRYPSFPILLETYRQCLRDVFDLPALMALLGAIKRREVRVDDVETASPSPFSRSLVFAYVARYLYEQDTPLAERRAQALTLDHTLLRELMGSAQLRDLLDAEAVEEVEAELQGLAEDRLARSSDELGDLLRRLGALTLEEADRRTCGDAAEWLAELSRQGRAVVAAVAGEERWLAVEDAARYRDALGSTLPEDLAEPLLAVSESPLEALVRRFGRTHGPFTEEQVAGHLGLLPAQVRPVLELLEAGGVLVRGEICPGTSGIQWCDAEVLRRLKRRSMARLRRDVAPVGGATLARFLARWHGLSSAQGRLLEAVTLLEGLPLPWSLLHRHLLAARAPGFRLEELDLLAASGRVVWVGDGSLGKRDGRVRLYRREGVSALLDPPAPPQEGPPAQVAILRHLAERGACFTVELAGLVAGSDRNELDGAIWDLVWAGQITNDTFLPLRGLGVRADRRRGSSGGLAGGRWSRVADLARDELGDTERSYAWVQLLLDRYGLITREVVQSEAVAGGFARLYPVLKEMEEAGRVRRGHFVAGLSGAQFALPGAVESLRSVRQEGAEDGVCAIPTLDPANPWGSLLPWPEQSREGGPRPRRVASAWLVQTRGRPLLVLDLRSKGLFTFRELAEEPDLKPVFAVLARILKSHRLRSLLVERIDGLPAKESPLAPALCGYGAVAEYRGLRLSR